MTGRTRTTSRRRGGALAKAAGASFEAWLVTQHEMAVWLSLAAWLLAVSPRVRWIGRGRSAVPKVVGPGVSDFVGQLAPSGRALVVEAKSRRVLDGPLYLREIEPQQQAQLDACARGGGLALLAVEFRHEDEEGRVLAVPERFVCPWGDVPWKMRATARSVAREDLQPWRVRHPSYLRAFIPIEAGKGAPDGR